MSVHDGFAATIYGVDRSRWDVHGPLAGRQKVWIGESQLQAIYDAPLESRWVSSTGRSLLPRRRKWLPRDFTVGFHVDGEDEALGGQIESALTLALGAEPYPWDPQRTTARMVVTAPLQTHGPRTLYFEAREAPELAATLDPITQEYANTIFACRAGVEPMWESAAEVVAFEGSGTSGSGFITVSNPTDLPCEYTVELTPATWTIPDPSWVGRVGEVAPGGAHAGRTLPVVVTAADGIARLTRRRSNLLAQTSTGANLIARQQGQFLIYDLPPWLPETQLPISYTGAPAGGARAEYTLPRLWTRPWGGALGERPDGLEFAP